MRGCSVPRYFFITNFEQKGGHMKSPNGAVPRLSCETRSCSLGSQRVWRHLISSSIREGRKMSSQSNCTTALQVTDLFISFFFRV